jgi:hypothetical protein
VAERFPVKHIDNTATHLGLDPDANLVKKFGTSGRNFGRLVEKHPDIARTMPLTRAARGLKSVAGLKPIMKFAALARWLPLRFRVVALKTYRAMAYSSFV